MIRYRWVAARKAEGFPTTIACRVADVSCQAFNDWRARMSKGPTNAEAAEADLVGAIWLIHAEFDGTYGEPRVTEELARRGWTVNHKRVERLMRVHGIVGVHNPTRVRTPIPAENSPPLPENPRAHGQLRRLDSPCRTDDVTTQATSGRVRVLPEERVLREERTM